MQAIPSAVDFSGAPQTHTNPAGRAGLPLTSVNGATSRVTTAPAATREKVPIVTPGRTIAPAPREHPRSSRVTGCSTYRLERGYRSLAKLTPGPMNTSSWTRKPSYKATKFFTVTLSPRITSFSMNTPSQILQSRPSRAPGRMWENAHTLLPAPTTDDSQMPWGWTKKP